MFITLYFMVDDDENFNVYCILIVDDDEMLIIYLMSMMMKCSLALVESY